MHDLDYPSFFFTNNIGTPHREILSLMNCMYNKSLTRFFNFANSTSVIIYEVMDIGPTPKLDQ